MHFWSPCIVCLDKSLPLSPSVAGYVNAQRIYQDIGVIRHAGHVVRLRKGTTTCSLRPPFTASSPLCRRLPRWSDHEKAVGALARDLGFTQVSLSSEVMPMVRAVPRGYTVCADAYLTPKIRQYLKGFTSGFEGGLKVRLCDDSHRSANRHFSRKPIGVPPLRK